MQGNHWQIVCHSHRFAEIPESLKWVKRFGDHTYYNDYDTWENCSNKDPVPRESIVSGYKGSPGPSDSTARGCKGNGKGRCEAAGTASGGQSRLTKVCGDFLTELRSIDYDKQEQCT